MLQLLPTQLLASVVKWCILKVSYECKPGYSTDRKFGGDNVKFDSKCKADGTFVDVPSCMPIICPAVPEQLNVQADHAGSILEFPQELV